MGERPGVSRPIEGGDEERISGFRVGTTRFSEERKGEKANTKYRGRGSVWGGRDEGEVKSGNGE